MRHFVVLGKSGVGKSTLLRNMMVADLCSGVGFTCIDPNGDLIADILSVIPTWRMKDVIYLDPLHPEKAIGLNIVEPVAPSQRALMVSHVVSIFKHIWGDSWGPRMEDILRNSLFALIEQSEHEPVSLASLPKLLQDREYRHRLVARVTNPVVKNFFKLDYERWDKAFREQAISPVLNKVRAFLSDPALLHIIGQKRSSFDIRWAMDTNKVVLVSLPKGMLGAHVSKLIGSLLVTKISLASLSRQDTPQHLRVPHILYIDEAHSYALGVDYETILAEARKFALGLVLASQTLSQFSESAVAAMFGNASTIASYRVSHDDAQRIVRTFGVSGEGPKTAEQIFETVVPPSELQQLPDFISSCKPFATAGRMSLSSCRASLPSLPRTYAGSGATRAGRRTRST